MEEQEAPAPKSGGGDMPNDLEPVSPESNAAHPLEETATGDETAGSGDVIKDTPGDVINDSKSDCNEEPIPETECDQITTNDVGGEENMEEPSSKVVENEDTSLRKEDNSQESEAISNENEPVLSEDIVESEELNRVETDSNVDSKSANIGDSESMETSISDNINEGVSKDVSDKVSRDNEGSMDVDETPTEVRQNGPEECHDERGKQNHDATNFISEDEKMDVDEKTTPSQDNELEDKLVDEKQDSEKLDDEKPDQDNRENPEFETAPEAAEISHNDSQVLDPFNELMKDDTTKQTDKALDNDHNTSVEHIETNALDDDHMDSTVPDEDHTDVTDETLDDSNIADVTEGQGADEEICLLPDTEREISEADKLKALAAKKPTETVVPSADSAFDELLAAPTDSESKDDESNQLTVMKGEINTDENGEVQDSATLNSLHEDVDLGEDDSIRESQDAEKDKEDAEAEPEIPTEMLSDNVIQEISELDQTCLHCTREKKCKFRLVVDNETKYLCVTNCVKSFQEANPDKYTVSIRKVFIKEVLPTENSCAQCAIVKDCFYKITSEDEMFICGEECLKLYVGDEKDKHIITRRRKCVQEINEKEGTCIVCGETKQCIFEVAIEGEIKNICNNQCLSSLQKTQPGIFRVKKKKVIKVKQTPLLKLKVISNATDKYLGEGNKIVAKTPEQVEAARADRDRSFFRMCAQCQAPYHGNDKNLTWETMDFCNEGCLGKYQNIHGSHCANCKNEVSITSLGKYCVRFGYDIRQFCCSGCLEEFKKGLKICCYCQRDISSGFEGFLAPVGDKGQFKDFCSQFCVEKFDQMSRNPVPPPVWARCAVCSKEKPTQLEVAIDNKNSLRLCSEPCFAAFKFVNHIFPDQCRWCNKYFERKSVESYTIYTDSATHCFCTKACMNVYISNSRHIVPCNWCKVKKYNFDMIKRTLDNGQTMMMCSLNCLTLYQVSVTAVSSRRIKCDQCKRSSQAQYHLTMSDATVRNFCTYQCVMSFQGQYSKTPLIMEGDVAVSKQQAVPTGAPRRTFNTQRNNSKAQSMKIIDSRSTGGMPVIASVQSLASAPPPTPPAPLPPITIAKGRAKRMTKQMQQQQAAPVPERLPTPPPPPPPKPVTPPPPPPPKIFNHIIMKPLPPKQVKNMSTLTKPVMLTKGITCKPHMATKEVQTDEHLERRVLIPIPVPIYVPSPVPMYSLPFPVPVPIPLPIPIPVFIPTTRNTANGIMKEIKKIHEKMPTDPFEAELLMMAEMVAGDKKKSESDSESEEEPPADDGFSPDAMDTGASAFGEDVLQMALKMATEYEEPAVDLESAMTASTITPSSHPIGPLDDNSPLHHHQLMLLEQQRAQVAAAANAGRKRGRVPAPVSPAPPPASRAKRSRRHEPTPAPPPPQPEPVREPAEKPDANMCLKYTFGVNAWKQWVVTKNQEMEKSSIRRKPFKSEILQLTADELNYSLCLFVKEVRKPNGSEYAPDTIYYLVLGIQQYLFENGRIDNIFTDTYYEKFTECLDEVARKFSVLYNDSQYIVTRVEEEHLWECKQLGAHSPHVLLSTLMFFNTKHFNLVTPEEHMQLSFSHIMKHWKRNPNQPGAAKIPGSRNVLLRFYPPQSALEANSRKKKVYEQQENEENPLRCPVKLYEFYLSKCPESVKTRNDVFYLMPERSCVPDSPVWYSTQALGKDPLSKMLHRVKMVKEINIALLTS